MPRKDVPLEAMRGVASLSVLSWHLLGAFAPRVPGSLGHRMWWPPFTGPAAVDFFFVLSAFVLTRGALARGDALALARSAVKRWPRFTGPILVSVVFACALMRSPLWRAQAAGLAVPSLFLLNIANDAPAHPGLTDALSKGVFEVLFQGNYRYDTVFWTLPIEFRGSFLALGLALGLLPLRAAPRRAVALLALAAVAVWMAAPIYITFVAGVALALWCAWSAWRVPQPVAILLLAAGLYYTGFSDGTAFAGAALVPAGLPPDAVHCLAAVLILAALESAPLLRRPLSGRAGLWLGRISFPVYLLHAPVAASVGSVVFLAAQARHAALPPAAAALAVSVAVTFVLAVPLAYFDLWWVRQVNERVARAVTGGRAKSVHHA